MNLVLSIFLALFVADIFSDWYKIEKKGIQIKHTLDTVVAAALYGIALLVLVLVHKITLEEAATVAIVFPSIRWFGHDLGLNLLRGKPLAYVGTDQHSALTDKLITILRMVGFPAWVVRLLAIAFSVLIAYIFIGTI